MRVFVVFILAMFWAGQAYSQSNNRVALVVGNSNYDFQLWQLNNPQRDATSVAALLDDLGYDVRLVLDVSGEELANELDVFGDRIKMIGPSAETVFYYAGHAAQDDGQNYLVPVDATVRTLEALKFRSPPVALLFSDMRQARNAANIVILDACRDMPLPSAYNGVARTRSIGGNGLAAIQTTPNVFFAFAATEGNTADDGAGSNSPFTTALLKQLEQNPGLPISLMFERIAIEVIRTSNGAQRPEFRWGLEVAGWNFKHGRNTSDAYAVLDSMGMNGIGISARTTERSVDVDTLTATRHLDLLKDQCNGCPQLVALRGGDFLMGSEESDRHERPVRSISLNSFAIGTAEVTFDEWEACVAARVCEQKVDQEGWGRGSQPVYNVSWHEAQSYVAWLSDETKERYRLPTEAEWEYAARAGVASHYPFGNDPPSGIINCQDCLTRDASVRPRPAESNPNSFGLFNTLGNLAEWVQDCYKSNLSGVGEKGEANEPTSGRSCSHRVTRGGSFVKGTRHVKHSSREKTRASTQSFSIGFRVARDLPRGVREDP